MCRNRPGAIMVFKDLVIDVLFRHTAEILKPILYKFDVFPIRAKCGVAIVFYSGGLPFVAVLEVVTTLTFAFIRWRICAERYKLDFTSPNPGFSALQGGWSRRRIARECLVARILPVERRHLSQRQRSNRRIFGLGVCLLRTRTWCRSVRLSRASSCLGRNKDDR
jgi:hypothetical protein